MTVFIADLDWTYIERKESTQSTACVPINGCRCAQKMRATGFCNKRLFDGHFGDGNHRDGILALVPATQIFTHRHRNIRIHRLEKESESLQTLGLGKTNWSAERNSIHVMTLHNRTQILSTQISFNHNTVRGFLQNAMDSSRLLQTSALDQWRISFA